MKPDGKFKFGEWLPDQPDLDNPGLTVARNVIACDGGYKPFFPLSQVLASYPTRPRGGYFFINAVGPFYYYYVGTGTKLYNSGVDVSGSAYALGTGDYWRFAEYEGLVIAVNGVSAPQSVAAGGSIPFGNLGTGAPNARQVGVIGQFVLLGDLGVNLTDRSSLQWSGVDQPSFWPTPNTAAAIAAQSGIQTFEVESGPITGIANGDQFGLVFQYTRVTRVTYVGGQVVFQFDPIEKERGCLFPNSMLQLGGLTYFLSLDGVYVTDGTQVKSVSDGKTSKWFQNNVDFGSPERVYGGIDLRDRCIYWGLPQIGSGGVPQKILTFHLDSGRFTWCDQVHESIVTNRAQAGISGSVVTGGEGMRPMAFTSPTYNLCFFNGTPGNATLATAESEFVPGMRAIVSGVTPQVTGASSITVRVGSRTTQNASVVYTSALTPDPFTGDCNCFVDARYHRAEIDISGNFTQAIGGDFSAQPSSAF